MKILLNIKNKNNKIKMKTNNKIWNKMKYKMTTQSQNADS